MKVFLFTLAVLAVVVCVKGNKEGSDASSSSESDESNCPEKAELLIKRAVTCLAPNNTDSTQVGNMTPSEARRLIKSQCYNRGPIRQCLHDVIEESQKCFGKEQHRYFELLQDFLEVALDVACSHYGEKLARVYQNIRSIVAYEQSERFKSFVQNCMEFAGMNLNTPVDNIGLDKRIFLAYRAIKMFRQCIVVKLSDYETIIDDIDDLLRELLEKVKCVDPQNKQFVLCKDLNEDGSGEKECRLREDEGIDVFLRAGFNCLHSNHTGIRTNGILSLQEARALVKAYCDHQGPVRQCINDVVSDADACFNRTQHEAFKLYKTNLEVILDTGCSNNGVKFAKIFHELQQITLRSEVKLEFESLVSKCGEVSGLNQMQLETDIGLDRRIFLTYRSLQPFRKCLMDTVKDFLTSMNAFADITREILAKMKCFNPQENSIVLCRDLDDEGIQNKTCPSEIDNDDKKKVRQLLFDLGFQCVSVKNLAFEHLTNESSPDEVKAFIMDYCQGLPEVRDCLSDVSLLADVCLGTPRHRIFQVLQEMLETTLETGCSEDGDRLATIFAGLQEHKGTSGEATEAVYECIDMSVMKLKLVPNDEADAATDVRVYRELQSFEECVVNEIPDGTFRNLTESFLSDVMRELNCAEPSDGETALCTKVTLNKTSEEEP